MGRRSLPGIVTGCWWLVILGTRLACCFIKQPFVSYLHSLLKLLVTEKSKYIKTSRAREQNCQYITYCHESWSLLGGLWVLLNWYAGHVHICVYGRAPGRVKGHGFSVFQSFTWLAGSLNDKENLWSCRSELLFLLWNKSRQKINILTSFCIFCNGRSNQVVFTFDKLFSFQMSTHLFNWILDLSGTKDIFNIGRIFS